MSTDASVLRDEFVTVDAVLVSGGQTSRVDAFILTWVKMEKQLRRLFCFLVFQHPNFSDKNIDAVIKVITDNTSLYYSSFIRCIDKLGPFCVRDLIGSKYDYLIAEIKRIQNYRNKILHGQITGQNITSRQLERDVTILRDWISLLASSSSSKLGYNGVGRNTFRKAKAALPILKDRYPFENVQQFKQWLSNAAKRVAG